ncbi:MAG: hypothetical protein AAF431_07610 [Pseudomonadota bacterium]
MMSSQSLIRTTLWLSLPFNLFAAFLLAFPSSVFGQLVGLPSQVEPLYAGLSALLVALFGFAYAWLALQPKIIQPLLFLGAAGKFSVFVLVAALWFSGSISGRVVFLATGDLVFALLWFWWLGSQRALNNEKDH